VPDAHDAAQAARAPHRRHDGKDVVMLAVLALLAAPITVVEDTTLRLPRGTAIEIDAGMRGVRLESVSGDLVTVEGGVTDLGSALLITASGRFGGGGAPITVRVPAWARVEITTLGSIEV